MSCLYILKVNTLSVASFANIDISSQSIGCLFTLFMIFFAVQKLLSLTKSYHLFIFFFISNVLGDRSKNMLLWFMLNNVLSTFPSRSFLYLVLHLGLKSILSLFLHTVLERVLISLSTCDCSVFPVPLIKETVFSLVYSCLLCQRLIAHNCMGLFLVFLLCSTDYVCLFPSAILFWLL